MRAAESDACAHQCHGTRQGPTMRAGSYGHVDADGARHIECGSRVADGGQAHHETSVNVSALIAIAYPDRDTAGDASTGSGALMRATSGLSPGPYDAAMAQASDMSAAADGAGSGLRIMRKPLRSPSRPARSGTSSATCRPRGRASVLIRRISRWTSGGWSASCFSSWVLLRTSASSWSAVATCSCAPAGSTLLSSASCVKTSDSVASMIAPAKASPNDSPNEPAAELTPAASLTRSSEMGESV